MTVASSTTDAPSTALVFARDEGREGSALPLLVALHARGADAAAAIAAARARFGAAPDIVAPQAARPCNPFQSNLQGSAGYAGFTWYLGDDPAQPEPASFGDALCQLDVFTASLGRPFVLAGDGQGAVLASTLALHAPQGLAGVFAAGAAIPTIAGWSLPDASLVGVPVCIEDVDASLLERAQSEFRARGARTCGGAAFGALLARAGAQA